MAPKGLKLVAYHEAGHAVIAAALRIPFRRVSIVENDESRGHVRLNSDAAFIERLELGDVRLDTVIKHLCVTIAGVEAQRLFIGPRDIRQSFGWPTDPLEKALGDAASAVSLIDYVCQNDPAESKQFFRWAELRTRRLVKNYSEWIEAVAQALLRDKKLSYKEVRQLNPILKGLPAWE